MESWGIEGNGRGWGPAVVGKGQDMHCVNDLRKLPFDPIVNQSWSSCQACDFSVYRGRGWGMRDRDERSEQVEADGSFQTVDTRSLGGGGGANNILNMAYRKRRGATKQTALAYKEKLRQEEAMSIDRKVRSEQKKHMVAMQAKYQRMSLRHRISTEWSIRPEEGWKRIYKFSLTEMPKLTLSGKVIVEDMSWSGYVPYYAKHVEKACGKAAVWVDSNQYSGLAETSTVDDDIVTRELSRELSEPHVYCTDEIIRVLMCSINSVYSWHFNITKIEGKLIFDKDPQTIIDLVTVGETSYSAPLPDNEKKIDRPGALSYEATKLNKDVITQLSLSERSKDRNDTSAPDKTRYHVAQKFNAEVYCDQRGDGKKLAEKFEKNNCVAMSNTEKALVYHNPKRPELVKTQQGTTMSEKPGAYRYRVFNLPPCMSSNINNWLGESSATYGGTNRGSNPGGVVQSPDNELKVMLRTSVHAKLTQNTEAPDYVYICSFNDYDGNMAQKAPGKIQTQIGAIMAKEIRNNFCKIKQFVASATLAGATELKLAYCSRKNPNDAEKHSILLVQSHSTADLAAQIDFKINQAWAIVRWLCDQILSQPDGKYVILKDPSNPHILVYGVPEDEEPDIPNVPIPA